jgi:hypothetical protein
MTQRNPCQAYSNFWKWGQKGIRAVIAQRDKCSDGGFLVTDQEVRRNSHGSLKWKERSINQSKAWLTMMKKGILNHPRKNKNT